VSRNPGGKEISPKAASSSLGKGLQSFSKERRVFSHEKKGPLCALNRERASLHEQGKRTPRLGDAALLLKKISGKGGLRNFMKRNLLSPREKGRGNWDLACS